MVGSYSNMSPYVATSNSAGYLDVMNFIDIPAENDDLKFVITSVFMHRPDLLSYDIYKDFRLWWVFAVRNKDVLIDPIYDFIPGQVIFVPKISTIKKALGIS